MQLYSSSAKQFIRSCETNQIAEKLLSEFSARFGGTPGHSEIASWRNSLRAFADVLRAANFDSQGVLLEYRIPLTSLRVDCILTGRDKDGNQRAVAVELKQWTKAEADEGENEVTTFVGKGNKVVLHPSVQVQNYVQYLADTHEEFHSDTSGIKASGCAYLHNYAERENDPLLELKFSSVLKNSPLFNLDQTEQLIEHLQSLVGYGEGLDVMARVEKNSYRASKMLMKHVSDVVKGLPTYTLLDDQLVTLDAVMSAARKSFNGRKNNVILVRGGPGTGKSVVALNLLGQLMREGYSTNYATGSKAFTDTIRKIVGRRGSSTLKFTDSYVEAESKVLDVLIVDEAHRIREFTQKMFRPKSELPQFEELFNAAKTLVLFIDDDQTVRPKEIGSVQYLRDHAKRLGATVTEFELEAQFRCGGAKEFISWVDSTLQIREADGEEWVNNPDFDFQIVESPELLEEKIMGKIQDGYSARMVAGFCWPWSKPNADGTLVEDVCVGGFSRPWNAKPGSGKLAAGIPQASLWATETGGSEQVGCVYTAQGFEFDYAGVVFGLDLRYDRSSKTWIGDKKVSHDKAVKSGDSFLALVKNTYRVLLSRGMKGCYVYFQDSDTEEYFRSRVGSSSGESL